MNNGVRIEYKNVAPEAKENFAASTNDSEFNTLSQLQEYDIEFPNYGNPCELYQTVLDGKASVLPSEPENANIGLWSNQISKDNGTFDAPIVLTLTSSGNYSSQGLTFTFDKANNTYATDMNIKWYRDDVLLSDMSFTPNKANYSCHNQVEYYNKLIITFYSINMPQNRLRLTVIDFGYEVWFEPENLRNVKLIQELNPISTEISINTADFTLDIDTETAFLFQKKQPFSVYFNDRLMTKTFIRTAKRKSKNLWDIQTDDYIGILDGTPFYGGMYSDENAETLIAEIFRVARVPYIMEESLVGLKLTGYIPYTSCREALMQVAFAIGAVVDTSNSDTVKIFTLSNDIKQTIPLSRIMQGQSFGDEEKITGVEVSAHRYEKTNDVIEVFNSNNLAAGIGENILVKFSEPLWGLNIVLGEIVAEGANYAIINADIDCILTGKKYKHTTTIKRQDNPIVLASDVEKVVSVENATLVSANNIDNVLQKCYNYFTKTNTVNMKIIEGKHLIGGGFIKYGQAKYGQAKYGEKLPYKMIYDETVNVGDKIQTETEYSGLIDGIVERQTFNLNGGIIIKDCVVR